MHLGLWKEPFREAFLGQFTETLSTFGLIHYNVSWSNIREIEIFKIDNFLAQIWNYFVLITNFDPNFFRIRNTRECFKTKMLFLSRPNFTKTLIFFNYVGQLLGKKCCRMHDLICKTFLAKIWEKNQKFVL
jgi:hypothetical protein